MTYKLVQIEVTTYQPQQRLACDGPDCGAEQLLADVPQWRKLTTVNSVLSSTLGEFHFCSTPCLARWSAEAYEREASQPAAGETTTTTGEGE